MKTVEKGSVAFGIYSDSGVQANVTFSITTGDSSESPRLRSTTTLNYAHPLQTVSSVLLSVGVLCNHSVDLNNTDASVSPAENLIVSLEITI